MEKPLNETKAAEIEEEVTKRRNRRSLAIALSLLAFIVLIYLITFAIGPAILNPPEVQ